MFESGKTQFWATKTVGQRIPSRQACNSTVSITETVQSIVQYDQLLLTGRPQMLTTSDVCC